MRQPLPLFAALLALPLGATSEKTVIKFHQPDGELLGDEDVPGRLAILDRPIYKSNREDKIGRVTGSCTRIKPGKYWFCTGEVFLDDEPDSSLVISGRWTDGKGGVNAVVGGTGRFSKIAGGEGQYKVDEDSDGWNIVKITIYD